VELKIKTSLHTLPCSVAPSAVLGRIKPRKCRPAYLGENSLEGFGSKQKILCWLPGFTPGLTLFLVSGSWSGAGDSAAAFVAHAFLQSFRLTRPEETPVLPAC